MKYFYKGLSLAERSKDTDYEASIRNNIAGVYQELNKSELAEKEFIKAKESALKGNNKKLSTNISTNIAIFYIAKKKTNEALKLLFENLQFYKESKFQNEITTTLLNIAYAYALQKDKIQSLDYIYKAIKNLKENSFDSEIITTYTTAFEILNKVENYPKIIELATEAQFLYQKFNTNINNPIFYHFLSIAYENIGNHKLALKYNRTYIHLKDSLDIISNKNKVENLINLHQLENKEKENEILKKENEVQGLELRMYFITFISILVFLSIFMLYREQSKLRKQKEIFTSKLIDNIDKERERIAMDLHDDIGLRLTIIKQKVMHDSNFAVEKKEDIQNDFEKLLNITRKISSNLYPATLKHLTFKEYIDDLLHDIEEKTKIICSFEIEPVIDEFPLEQRMHLIRILQECLNNTLKYAHAKAIRIEIYKQNNKLFIIYNDNGIGFNPKTKQTGFGLQNIIQRTYQLGGEVVFSTQDNLKGYKMKISIKV